MLAHSAGEVEASSRAAAAMSAMQVGLIGGCLSSPTPISGFRRVRGGLELNGPWLVDRRVCQKVNDPMGF
jgi:hypothetical protein